MVGAQSRAAAPPEKGRAVLADVAGTLPAVQTCFLATSPASASCPPVLTQSTYTPGTALPLACVHSKHEVPFDSSSTVHHIDTHTHRRWGSAFNNAWSTGRSWSGTARSTSWRRDGSRWTWNACCSGLSSLSASTGFRQFAPPAAPSPPTLRHCTSPMPTSEPGATPPHIHQHVCHTPPRQHTQARTCPRRL